MTDKQQRLLELAHLRRASSRSGYRSLADFQDGRYECEYVSPYTKSADNFDSKLMVLLQDWASAEVLDKEFLQDRVDYGHDPMRSTNKTLRARLKTHFEVELCEVYATNVFPLVKPGRQSARIPLADLVWAAREFAIPQLAIVDPVVAVCLGLAAFKALAKASGQRIPRSMRGAIASPIRIGTTDVWCQAHTSRLGQNNRNRGGVDRASADWARMAAAYYWQPEAAATTLHRKSRFVWYPGDIEVVRDGHERAPARPPGHCSS
jgi:restriction system protein